MSDVLTNYAATLGGAPGTSNVPTFTSGTFAADGSNYTPAPTQTTSNADPTYINNSDPSTPVNTALENDNLVATLSSGTNSGSLGDGIYNAVTKGIPLVAASVVNSFANTGIELGNFFGADSQKISMSDEFDDPDTLAYYQKNQGLIEGAGLLVGSLLPGTLAIKGLRLARAGEASASLAEATGLLRPNVSAKIIQSGLSELQEGTAAVFPGLQAQKYTAIAAGFADNVLEGVAFQTATYATMKASPVTDDASLQDVVEGITYGGLLNGAIGGLIDGIKTNGVFQKIKLSADVATKGSELTNEFGGLDLTPGDRLLSQQIAKDNIAAAPSTATTSAGKLKGQLTTDNITLKQRIVAKDLADGDGELGDALVSALQKTSDSVGANKDVLADKFGALAKISRVDTTPSGIPDGSTFFVNRYAPTPTGGTTHKLEDLLSGAVFNDDPAAASIPAPGINPRAVFGMQYKLNDPSIPPSIASYSSSLPTVEKVLKQTGYQNAEAAWKDGHDLFVNAKGDVIVNPKSQNISPTPLPGMNRVLTQTESAEYAKTGNLPADSVKQLVGTTKTTTAGTLVTGAGSVNPLTEIRPAQTILNTKTGELTSSISAVPVGDLGPATLSRDGTSIEFGGQSVGINNPASLVQGTPTEANAQYVGSYLRKITKGDVIQPDNIPAMEQLYRQGLSGTGDFSANITKLGEAGVRMGDGTSLPTNAQDLLGQIKNAKDRLISNLTLEGKEDMDSIAMRANVSKDYIINNMQGKTADFMLDPKEHMNINHISLGYDIGNTNVNDGMVLRGMQDVSYRTQVAQDAATSQLANFVGRSPGNIPYTRFISTKTAADANILGAGSTSLGQANAGYGTLGQEMENIGRNYDALKRARLDDINSKLLGATNSLRADPIAGAEAGMFLHVRQSTGHSFSPLPADLMAEHFPAAPPDSKIAVLTDSLAAGKDGKVVWDKSYMPDNFISGDNAGKQLGNYNYYPLSPKVAAWEDANAGINDSRITDRNGLNAAQGYNTATNNPLGTYYTPPINTKNYPFFAYVKPLEGSAFSDNGVSVIVGRTAEELQQKVASLSDGNFSVYFKNQIAADHKIVGDYEYGRNFANTQVNTALKSRGILNDLTPTTRADNIIQDMLDWHARSEASLIRDHIELANAPLFANLDAMGQRFQDAATSQFGPVQSLLSAGTKNPYKQYTNTALGIGNKENYPVWQYAQQKLSAFGDTAFDMVRAASKAAMKGILTYEEAGKVAAKYGIGNLWDTGMDAAKNYYSIANKLPPANILQKMGGVANTILGNGMIRLDAFQQMIHVLSAPIMMSAEFQSLVKNNAELATVAIPGTNGTKVLPSVTKMMYQGVRNFFDETVSQQYGALYSRVGVDNEVLASQRAAQAALGLPLGKFAGSITDWANNAISKVPILGNNLPQKFIHFVAADVGRQMFEAAGQGSQELETNLSTWMNRVQGNYVASQRPVAFQGPLGQAIGLFQTYQFNVAQQLFRYIGDGDAAAIASGAAIHGSLFGLQGMPGFHMLNNAIIGNANGNPNHNDIFSASNNYLGKEMSDWLLYGAISNVTQTGLYTRGDMNPRQISILPINPLNYPAIAGGIKLASSLVDTAGKIAQGGGIGSSILLGLEHNGVSRPLSGLAQLAQGFTTDSKGNIVSANTGSNYAGISDLQSAFNMGRLIGGGRQLDDAIATDALYRKSIYQAKTEARLEALGQSVKTSLYGGSVPSQEQMTQFAAEYRNAGGDAGKFSAQVFKWSHDANVATANKLYTSNKQSPFLQNIQASMGGQRLPDFTTQLSSFDSAPSNNYQAQTRVSNEQ